MKKEEIIKKLEEDLEKAGDYIVDLRYDEAMLNMVKIVKFHGEKSNKDKIIQIH
ncbi:unnamed protein product [marine sediment metagenome]|uniref:Uncharacterized protein n=1 Tax=marine sediment metagenome TaxID=412755 RepID=X1B565_9ZZZZ